MSEYLYLEQAIKPLALQVLKDMEQKFGYQFDKNYVDTETGTLFIFGKPVLSATQEISGQWMFDPEMIKPDTFQYWSDLNLPNPLNIEMKSPLKLNNPKALFSRIVRELTPEYLESLYSQINDKTGQMLPWEFCTRESRANTQGFYKHQGLNNMIAAIIKATNIHELFPTIENTNLVINQEFKTLLHPYRTHQTNFDFFSYMQGLSIFNVIMIMKGNSRHSLNTLYYVFCMMQRIAPSSYIGESVKCYEDYFNGDFIVMSQDKENRIKVADRYKVSYMLSDRQAWQWLLTKAVLSDFLALKEVYESVEDDSSRFDLCREAISAIARADKNPLKNTEHPIHPRIRALLIRNLVNDSLHYDRLGAGVFWHEEYFNIPEYGTGEIFRNMMNMLVDCLFIKSDDLFDFKNFLKFHRKRQTCFITELSEKSLYSVGKTDNPVFALNKDNFPRLYSQHSLFK